MKRAVNGRCTTLDATAVIPLFDGTADRGPVRAAKVLLVPFLFWCHPPRYGGNFKIEIEIRQPHSTSLSPQSKGTKKMDREAFTVDHVRQLLCEQFGIPDGTWHYHKARMPQPDQTYGGWPFYSATQIDFVRAYWLKQSGVKRYLRQKAEQPVA
ncbi:hypothetical protein [Gemmata obscuriglobus]|nr:hypothetical protein [Gemmata obscuriglobus]